MVQCHIAPVPSRLDYGCRVAGAVLGVGCLVAGWPVVPLLQVPNRLRLTEPKGISPLRANPPITELRSGALDR
jgi:hypothetical protein